MSTAIGAALGLALALFAFKASSLLGPTPEFPIIRGEPDLELRYAVYLLGTCPALAGLGGWIGFAAPGDRARTVRRSLGALAGSAVAFIALRLAGPALPAISSSWLANSGAIAFLVIWVALAWLGAIIAGSARVRKDVSA